ncbi:MAG: nucleotidyl transferase AbiEii/AbiGii toxin family protein [Opitutaceae bacterium]|nr:nucleotidyl transferase AbiEii/AbiGii toxin family protein [Opitutaceae bacterium]
MKSRQEIIAWRRHAAWATDAQVEQDLLLTLAMAAIFRDSFLSAQVAMRGGTALHKLHLAPAARYSEDIDLVLVGKRPVAHIERALVRVLAPLLGRPASRAVGLMQTTARNLTRPSKIRRLTYTYAPTAGPPSEMKIKIEVNYSERKPCYAVTSLPYAPPLPGLAGITVKSYDLDEMLGTKMRALLQRSQGRDLFDLDCACVRHDEALARGAGPLLDPQRVVNAFATYMRREGVRVTRAQYDASLQTKLAARAFRHDMAKVLPPDVAYDIDAAAKRVRDTFVARLPA